jgi:hypothetical protein
LTPEEYANLKSQIVISVGVEHLHKEPPTTWQLTLLIDVLAYGARTAWRLPDDVKRNLDRLPEDFVFQLTETETAEVITVCDHLRRLRFLSSLP